MLKLKQPSENDQILQEISQRQTSLKEMSRYLSELESQLSLIFAASPDIIIFLNKTGKILKISDAATLILGYSKEEMIDKQIWDFIEDEYVEESIEWFNRTKQNKLVYYNDQQMFVNQWITKNGSTAKLLWRFSLCDDREQKIIGVASDITQLGVNSIFNAKLLQAAMNSSTDGIVIVDAQTQRVVYSNNSFEKMTGYSPAEVQKKKYDFFQTTESKNSRAFKTLQQCLETGKNCDVLLQFVKKNNEYLYCRVCISAALEKDIVTNYIINYRDITDKIGHKYEWSPNTESGFIHLTK